MSSVHLIIKNFFRARFASLAVAINNRFGSRITASDITWTGFVAHLPIAYFIIDGQLVLAGLLLIFFGLFDTLDGALARAQNTASVSGMFLDASTDRIKEVILYSAFAVYFLQFQPEWGAVAAVAACGISLCVSYVKAKGEAAIALTAHKMTHAQLNRLFGDGIGSFETRMLLLVIGCLFGIPEWTIAVVVAISFYTLCTRFTKIMKALNAV